MLEIEKMITLIGEQQKAVDAQLSWRTDERQTNNEQLGQRNAKIAGLENAITDVDEEWLVICSQ